jgi:hypothetical protein
MGPSTEQLNEPLCLRLIFEKGPGEDAVVPLSWVREAVTLDRADRFLREIATTLGACGARIETRNGGLVRAYHR